MSEFLQPYIEVVREGRTEEVAREIAGLLRTDVVRERLHRRGQRGLLKRNATTEQSMDTIRAVSCSPTIDAYVIADLDEPESIVGVATVMDGLPLFKRRKSAWPQLPTFMERRVGLLDDVTPRGPNIFAWTHPNYEEELSRAYAELAQRQLEQEFKPHGVVHTWTGSFEVANVGWTLDVDGLHHNMLTGAGFRHKDYGLYDEGEFRWEFLDTSHLYTLTASRKIESSH
jgi:hypothetical protein